MIEYNFIFIIVCLLIFFNTLVPNKLIEKVSFWFVYLLIVVLAGFRYEISSDYVIYEQIFNTIAMNDGFNFYFIEPGFIFLNKSLIFLGLNYEEFIFTIAILSIGIKFYFIEKLSNKKLISALLFFSFYLFLYDLGAIRRGLALGFITLSIFFYLKERKLETYIFVLIAASIHVSALIMIPVFLIAPIKFSLPKLMSVILVSFILQYIVTNLVHFTFLEQLNNPVAMKALGYFKSGDYFIQNSFVSIGLMIRILLAGWIIYYQNRLISHYPYIEKLIYLFVMSLIFLIIFDKLRIFSSVAIFFKITELLIIPYLFFTIKKSYRYIYFSFIITYSYLSFYKLVNNPYETDYLPYISIFNK